MRQYKLPSAPTATCCAQKGVRRSTRQAAGIAQSSNRLVPRFFASYVLFSLTAAFFSPSCILISVPFTLCSIEDIQCILISCVAVPISVFIQQFFLIKYQNFIHVKNLKNNKNDSSLTIQAAPGHFAFFFRSSFPA